MAKTNAINALMHVTKQRHTAAKPLAKRTATFAHRYMKTARPATLEVVHKIVLPITAKQSARQAARVSLQLKTRPPSAIQLATNVHTSAPAVGIQAHVHQEKHAQMKSVYRTTAVNATSMHNARPAMITPTRHFAKLADIFVRKVVGKEKATLNAPRVTIHPYNLRAIAALAERMVGKLKPADNPAERLAANA